MEPSVAAWVSRGKPAETPVLQQAATNNSEIRAEVRETKRPLKEEDRTELTKTERSEEKTEIQEHGEQPE